MAYMGGRHLEDEKAFISLSFLFLLRVVMTQIQICETMKTEGTFSRGPLEESSHLAYTLDWVLPLHQLLGPSPIITT